MFENLSRIISPPTLKQRMTTAMKHIKRALQKTSLQDNDDRTTPVRWSGIIGTGQSLGMGGDAPLKQPTEPARGGLKLDDTNEPHKFDIERPGASSLRVVPLTEPFRQVHPIIGHYPVNIAGKTPHSAMAAQIYAMASEKDGSEINTVHSCVAYANEQMSSICRGGSKNSYQASMYEAKALTRLAKRGGNVLEYDAIVLTHGENDAGECNKNYLQQLITMQKDYAADLRATTGQTSDPVMILSQVNSCPDRGNEVSTVPQAQWRVQQVSNDAVICSGPKYQYGYHVAFLGGNLHLEGAANYDRLGEKYGQAFYQTIIEKKAFVPLRPTALRMPKPKKIKIDFHVPCPPLQFDQHLNSPHVKNHQKWSNGRGFEVWGGKGVELKIENVHIGDDGTSVIITLAKPPTTTPVKVAYAMTADQDGFSGGCAGGRVGHLCDSDDLPGASAEWIKVNRTKGSKELTSDDAFQNRAIYDFVDPGNYVVREINTEQPNRMVLDRAWQGDTGKDYMYFRHNHRNYLVAFYAQIGDEPFSDSGW